MPSVNRAEHNRSRGGEAAAGPITNPISRHSIPTALVLEGERVMRLCNACRYCEGYCAVFPAMERRTAFTEQELGYLANLCHNCSECYYACPYSPPHEFSLNLPRTLAEIRTTTYHKYAWPGFFRPLFRKNGLTVAAGMVAGPALFLLAMLLLVQPAALFAPHSDAEGSFYAVLPHRTMTITFGAVSLLVLAALAMGLLLFWRDTGESMGALLSPGAWRHALWDTLRLRYLEGGHEGDTAGCAYPGEEHSHARRWFHHLTFYGFLLCFAATTTAAFYHYALRWPAPYPFWSAPVILGTLGGAGLLVGPAGLLWLKRIRNPEPSDPRQTGMDVAFIVLLFFTSLTGFLLLALRESTAMGVLLAVHLGMVAALFVTMPYGKFVHATYRFAALLRNGVETRGSARTGSGSI